MVLTGKSEKIRGTTRIEFVCGKRALRRARADNRLVASIGRALSVPPEQSPELLAGLIEKNKSLEKTAQRLATELARREGKDLYLAAEPGPDGIRRMIQRGPIDDAMRARAQAFVAGEKAVFLAVCDQPPSLLLAASADSGIHAGDRVKAAVTASQGRGGGNQQLAQGSVPDAAALAERGGFATLKLMLENYAPLRGRSRSVRTHLGSGIPVAPDRHLHPPRRYRGRQVRLVDRR